MARRYGGDAYCGAAIYIKTNDRELFDLMEKTCTVNKLSTRVGGVTFIMPNKTLRDKIISLYKTKPVEAEQILTSLIIPEFIPKLGAFKGKTVGNKLMVKFPEVKSASDKEVEFVGGLTLEPTSFETYGEHNSMVYKLKEGSPAPPLAGEEYKFPPRTPKHGKVHGKAGGKADGSSYGSSYGMSIPHNSYDKLCNFYLKTHEAFIGFQRAGKHGKNPHLDIVMSFLNFLKNNGHSDVYRGVVPLMSYDVVESSYLLFEPFNTSSNRMIDISLINEWNYTNELYGDAYEEYMAMQIPGNQREILDKLSNCRDMQSNITGEHSSSQALCDIYRGALGAPVSGVGMGKCQNLHDIINKETISLLGRDPITAVKKKLWQDVTRFRIRQVTMNPYFDQRELLELMGNLSLHVKGADIENFLITCDEIEGRPSKNYLERVIQNQEKCGINKLQIIDAIHSMTRSTLGFYIRFSPDVLAASPMYSTTKPSPAYYGDTSKRQTEPMWNMEGYYVQLLSASRNEMVINQSERTAQVMSYLAALSPQARNDILRQLGKIPSVQPESQSPELLGSPRAQQSTGQPRVPEQGF